MLNIIEEYLQKVNQQKQTQHRFRQTITALSLIVILSVSWGLKLTGITLAGEAFCGFEEHTHNENCTETVLVCELAESEPHVHSEACIARKLICSLEEEEPHTHSQECLKTEYICGQQEIPAHTHTEECYGPVLICEEAECGGHHHEELCYEEVPDCGLEETEGHTHSDDCQVLTLCCGEDEAEAHTHDDSCTNDAAICEIEETPGHVHQDDCYSPEIGCGLEEEEPHSHYESCMITELACGMEECTLHLHDESCYGLEITCGLEESETHTHEDSCMSEVLQCEEIPCTGHFHEDGCYEQQCICGLEETEGHVHEEACEQIVTACGRKETPGHTHEDSCWEPGIGFGCGLTEADGHIHTEACLTEETELGCGLEISEGHTHTDDCYETRTVCEKEEHIHIESCYSDVTADLETSDDWEMSLAGMTRGATTAENVIKVATSQLGSRESERNFVVDANGTRRGITRYGQWYGNPYGDWSSMFASFCLYYAGAEDLPANAGAESMRLEWEAAGLYKPVQEYTPRPGNLLFLSKNQEEPADTPPETTEATEASETIDLTETTETVELQDTANVAAAAAEEEVVEEVTEETEPLSPASANAVAIITAVSEDSVTVIEGDLDNAVAEATYSLDDPMFMGYGLIPEVSEYAALIDPPETASFLAKTITYSSSIFSSNYSFVVYAQSGENYYAFDGSGNAIPIFIDEEGNILADTTNPNSLLWTFTASNSNYVIRNVETGRYMHSYSSNGNGVTTTGAYTGALSASGSGAILKCNNKDYFKLNVQTGIFQNTTKQAEAAVFYFGRVSQYTVWLDGTDGGLRALTGAPNTPYTVQEGSTLRLPTEWNSPSKYSYKLRGWYDVTNSRYYPPGAEMTVTGNAVLYADWVASTYDLGEFNAKVADTVSTNAFITTHMFDYNYLLNLHSVRTNSPTVNASGHSENWTMVTSGNVAHGNAETLNFIFVENDASNGFLCMPNNRSSINTYPGAGKVTPGIYSDTLYNVLFSTDNCYDPATGTGVLGKTYLGTGDHLFQIMDDPNDEHYGYYYYDSRHNAASYHQSNSRFYVYEYLEATSDSIGSTNSDFLPLNSPYANTNGKVIGSYNYDGVDGEYAGIPHYRYDSKYDSGNYNSTNNVNTDYAYGMRTDINFYLPMDPGSGGNKDLHGNNIQFQFSGDDDLWVLVDGQLVLDIGGIHGAEEGVIDFSTGKVTVQGKEQTSLMDLGITAGDHTLTMLYLERGSSMSNCSIYFNLVPRFGLEIQKEDVLTQNKLNGTQFTVYEDFECTKPAELWTSENAYRQDLADGKLDKFQSTFTVSGGVAKLWGLGSGNTYYIKETGPPAAEGYGLASGVIRLKVEKKNQASYQVDVIPDAEGNEPSNGFTVHGVRIDEETQTVYIVATNAPETVVETTTVQVIKKWEDNKSHSDDYITAYLKVTDPDGSVRRIREVILSDENEWNYVWTNLPKYDYEAMTEVQYGIEESYESGYYSTVRKITEIDLSKTVWSEAVQLVDDESYILKNTAGKYLSTTSNSDLKLKWVDEETAKESPLALWTATVSGSSVKLTNGAGHRLTYNNGFTSSSRYFYAHTTTNSYQTFTAEDAGSGFRFKYSSRYMASLTESNGRISTTTGTQNAMVLIPMKETTETDIQPVEDWAYEITNTPLAANNETSMTVKKTWNLPPGYNSTLYREFSVTVRLLANGVNTGRTITLNLKNNWQSSFLGLPYKDDNGNVITYEVEEIWDVFGWTSRCGEVITSNGSPPTYSVEIVNTYYPGGPQLPSTGSAARRNYILCGYGIMIGSLVYGFGSRRKRERRMK